MSAQRHDIDSGIAHLDSLRTLKMLRATIDDIESGRVLVAKRQSHKTMFGNRFLSVELQEVEVKPKGPARPIRFPAEHVCCIPSGHFACCARHLKHFDRIATQLCLPIHVATAVGSSVECTYCASEAVEKAIQGEG
tara:strand:- start:1519 stop:1926 length:408 start_codon:yes stop_codon:yes gene_type:complete